MCVDYELKVVEKNEVTYYILEFYFVYDSGKKRRICSTFLNAFEYQKLKDLKK